MIAAEWLTRRESVPSRLSEFTASEDELIVQPVLGRTEPLGLLGVLGQWLDPVAVPEHLLKPRGSQHGDTPPVVFNVPSRLTTIVRLEDPQPVFAVGTLHRHEDA